MEVKKYLKLVKFSHTIFAMPFALAGFFLAVQKSNQPSQNILIVFALVVLDMVFARNAAMGFNRYIDRNIDAKNPRTASREIPSKQISSKSALLFVVINSILFFTTTFFINRLTFFLSPIALFVILFYSYTKRFTWLCHFVLGVGLSLAPIGAYLAIANEFALTPILISFAVLFWTAGFDIIYALQDVSFDKANNLKSIPVLLGKRNALILSAILHILTAIFIIWAGVDNFGWLYWVGTSLFCLSLIYQHLIIKPHDLSKVNLAFFTTNGVASVVFALFCILSLYV